MSYQASEKLDKLKRQLKDLSSLKQHAIHVTKTQKEIERLGEDIASLETELSRTGSAKTADEVQTELDEVANKMSVHPVHYFDNTVLILPSSIAARMRERSKLLWQNVIVKTAHSEPTRMIYTRCKCKRTTSRIRFATRIPLKRTSPR